MTYKTILVHLQLAHPHAALLDLAARLGDRFEARLVGVAAFEPLQTMIAEGCASGALIAGKIDQLRRETAVAERAFHAALGARPAGVAWHASSGGVSIADHVVQLARGADLVLTDTAPGGLFDTQRHMQLSELLMRAGRPVLIVPAPAAPLPLAHALVAWDDSRACRRALSDALPLLGAAARVSVVQVAHSEDHAALSAQLGQVVDWLRSHGVMARALLLPADGTPPPLVAIALGQACDLIVAGAYGHSRLREWALGGVTRALVEQQQLAVLLSH
ncbi:universal stress protein [Massilia sp. DWR3-1-1]|uniref:universal stress protein n=1 Tax=Massilia sp. DWR3-1-1 TaxID=2804559 RepID=UPI003CEA45DB